MASKLMDSKQGTKINSVRFSSDGGDLQEKIPKGAEVLSTEHNVDVEEIENGFLICKRTTTKYIAPGKEYNDYASTTKKWYSETNPLTIDTEDKELADMFDEED